MILNNICIRHVWYSSLEYTESDIWDSLVPQLEFGINIPKYSELNISGYFLESIFQISILWILVPLVKFCPIRNIKIRMFAKKLELKILKFDRMADIFVISLFLKIFRNFFLIPENFCRLVKNFSHFNLGLERR